MIMNHAEYIFLTKLAPQQTINQAAQLCQTSTRTIRNYVRTIHREFPLLDLHIEKGVLLFDQSQLLSTLQLAKQQDLGAYTLQQRMAFILAWTGQINLNAFARDAQISRNTAKSYLKQLEQPLRHFQCSLNEQNHLEGKEENIRSLLLYLLNQPILDSSINELCSEMFQHVDFNQLAHYLDTLNLTSDFLYKLNRNFLAIALARHQQHPLTNEQPIIPDEAFKQLINDGKEYAAWLTLQNETHLSDEWLEYHLLVLNLIQEFSSARGINLNSDKTLFKALLDHIRPTLYRIEHQLKPEAIQAEAIRNQFTREYDLIEKILINMGLANEQDKEEIALLTIHFQTAINRIQGDQKTVIIFCPHGYGTSTLISQYLNEHYQVNILATLPLYLRPKAPKADIILSTVPLEGAWQVSPQITQADQVLFDQLFEKRHNHQLKVSELLEVINEHMPISNKEALAKKIHERFSPIIQNDYEPIEQPFYLYPQAIKLNQKANSWQEAILIASQALQEMGCFASGYEKALLEAFEKHGDYMMLNEGIALPHARPTKDIRKTGVAIVKTLQPVQYHDQSLQFFIVFCSRDEKEHIDTLVKISHKFNHPQKIFECDNPLSLYFLLKTNND